MPGSYYVHESRFWRVPELIAEVLDYLRNADLGTCARISHTVSHEALRKLYKEGVSLQDILAILGPVARGAIRGEMMFTKKPLFHEWQRFCYYAQFVESLSCKDVMKGISDEAFLDILLIVPPGGVIFPRLRVLEWGESRSSGMRRFNVFVTASLRELVLSSPMRLLPGIFSTVSRSSPHLRRLSVKIPDRITVVPAQIQEQLATALATFRHLQQVEISSAFLTAEVLCWLSEKHHLATVSIHSYPHTYMQPCPLKDEPVRLAYVPFPSLTHLTCDIDILFIGGGKLLVVPSIRKLHLHIPVNISEKRLKTCAALFATKCDDLESLSLLIRRPMALGDYPSPITANILKVFLRAMPRLLSFDIDDVRPVSITAPELEQLAPLCHNLVELNLCVHALGPPIDNSPDLGSLIPFAKHCLDLEVLGIYMDATDVPDHSPISFATFTRLRQLNVYYNMEIIYERGVAEYLCQFLSPDTRVQIKPATRPETAVDLANSSERVRVLARRWEDVDKLLVEHEPLRALLAPAYTRVRMADKILDNMSRGGRTAPGFNRWDINPLSGTNYLWGT
ncbi:hypothetical protein SISNIDRAFT_454168 [Sistotremastrum niveocremeum HHB9708]|uniref:F-box domain-containing protein n=1 Tax=Sistotremastrum niveocremeum HHB9708 TaxID=1314777 RepID=A0A164V296_9AGAM|nr:hypothetical protein SISNIDRAFT_454168 [Sistotremastrum niveocremeum HHB9708]